MLVGVSLCLCVFECLCMCVLVRTYIQTLEY
jgi:hypothetical protein